MFRHHQLLLLVIFLILLCMVQLTWLRSIKEDRGIFDNLSYVYQATTTAAQTAMSEITAKTSSQRPIGGKKLPSQTIRGKPRNRSKLHFMRRNNTYIVQPPRPKVLYTVFAGRKNRLLLQEPYWLEMYELGVIDEVHIWNYTNHRENSNYIRHVADKYSAFLSIKQPSSVAMEETLYFDKNHTFQDAIKHDNKGRAVFYWPGRRGYSEYYKYYTDNPYDGVIIKADDDTVFVNSTMVPSYASYLWNHKEIFLLSASVVNQGLCAHYQQKHNAIPESYEIFPFANNGMGDLQTNATQAFRLHSYFLSSEENRKRFFIRDPAFYEFKFTINVNFVAIRGEDMYITWDMILKKLKLEKRYYDEGAITWDAIRFAGMRMGIYMPMVVAHATYSHQLKLERQILSLWTNWAKKEKADFYKGIL
mmetsp:Transcript_4582/g.6607  ORF Transcript_4582/g.6607 Transcript_4582/m.6607 type:complete len:418 (-) Transcript_4582:172-1425(-)